ncbi:MAG: type sorting protein [Bacteroidetes bacterium]|nr:type sorting protein [Bacteroidota bacterium]
MKILLLFSIGIISCFSLQSQSYSGQWAESGAGTGHDAGHRVAADATGNSYVCGQFKSRSISFGAYTLVNSDTSGSTADVFLVKYDPAGTVLWARSAGGSAFDIGLGLAVDPAGDILLGGYFISKKMLISSVFLTNADASASTSDIFIAKYTSSGSLLWAKSEGAEGDERLYNICSDVNGNVLATGTFKSNSVIFGPAVLTNSQPGNEDIFIAKYDPSGMIDWAQKAGGWDIDYSIGIATDTDGNVIITGSFHGTDITFGGITLVTGSPGFSDVFIAKYNASGNVLWAKSAGSSGGDFADDVAVDADGNIFITGQFYDPVMHFDAVSVTNTIAWTSDAYLAKYDASGNALWARSGGGDSYDAGFGICCDGNDVIITGSFTIDSIKFGTTTLLNEGSYDIFAVRYDGSGNLLWARSAGGTSGDYSNDACIDANENLFLTGCFYSPVIALGTSVLMNGGSSQDVFLMKFADLTEVGVYENDPLILTVYPNPGSGIFHIVATAGDGAELIVTNLLGEVICSRKADASSNGFNEEIDLSGQSCGMYLVQLVSSGDAGEKIRRSQRITLIE